MAEDPVADSGRAHPRSWPRRWFRLIAVLVVLAALVIGGSVQHTIDQRHAARVLYGYQVLSAASRFLVEENRQMVLPRGRRSAGALGTLSGNINDDLGINGGGTLDVELGSGSINPPTQIAFAVTVSSPYASTTVVLWTVRNPGPPSNNESINEGSCLLTSTLVGTGRVTTGLDFGESGLEPCTPDLWRASPASAVQPDLTLAGIPTSGRP